MTIYITGQGNYPNTIVDFIEVKTPSGKFITIDWNESDWDTGEDGSFNACLKKVCFNEECANGRINELKGAKITYVQFYSDDGGETDIGKISTFECVDEEDALMWESPYQKESGFFIKRNGENIYLTPDEIEMVFRYQKHNYQLQDAERQFYSFVGYDPDDDAESSDNIEAATKFKEEYGFDFDEVVNTSSTHYLLDKFVKRFERFFDCNSDENSTWESAIRYSLDEQKL